MTDKYVEIGMRLREEVSSAVDRVKKTVTEFDRGVSTNQARRQFGLLERAAFSMGRELGSTMRLMGVTGSLIGGGVVASLTMAGRALGTFANSGSNLHYLSEELGVTAERLKQFEYAGRGVGMTGEQASQGIESALRAVQDITRRGPASEFYQSLVKAGVGNTGQEFADAIMQEGRAGGPGKALEMVLGRLQSYGSRGNSFALTEVQKVLGMGGAGWYRLLEVMGKVGQVTVPSKEASLAYSMNMSLLNLQMENLQNTLGNALLPTFTKLTGELNTWLQGDQGKAFTDSIVLMGKSLDSIQWEQIGSRIARAVSYGAKLLSDAQTKGPLTTTWELLKEADKNASSTMGGFVGGLTLPKLWDFIKRDNENFLKQQRSQPQRFSSGTFSSSGQEQVPHDPNFLSNAPLSTNIEDRRGTVDLTKQMRDTGDELRELRELLRRGDIVISKGGGSGSGSGSGAGVGGGSGGGGGTWSGTGTGGSNDRTGSSEYGSGVARPSLGGTQGGKGDFGDAAPSDVLEKAKQVATQGGPAAVEKFMADQGYPKSGAWCGQFAASVVKAGGGVPPPNAALASSWRKFANPATGDPQPGDVAVRKGPLDAAGRGSHVTFVESYDPKTGRFTGYGGNQGHGRMPGSNQYSASRFDFRRGDGAPSVGNAVGFTGRVSTFDDKVVAPGGSSEIPGIALRQKISAGQMYAVRDPSTGKTIVMPQTDWGPHVRTGRDIDVNRQAAGLFGYNQKNFPTDSTWSARPIGREEIAARNAVDKSLMRSMVKGRLTGKAAIDINVGGGAKPGSEDIEKYFSPIKIGRTPQMPNTGGNSGDYNSSNHE